MTQHLDRPFDGQYPVTQTFANNNPGIEPADYLYHDGGVGFTPAAGATAGHYHTGVDYGLPCGTPLLACAAGTVVFAGWDNTGFGNRVSVDHGNGLQTLVAHMSALDVHVGQRVSARQRLGLSGTTGNSTGCHTHWSVQQGDAYVSPLPYLNAPVPAPPPPPAVTPPPADAAAAVAVLARHVELLTAHPSVGDTNALVHGISTWPIFKS